MKTTSPRKRIEEAILAQDIEKLERAVTYAYRRVIRRSRVSSSDILPTGLSRRLVRRDFLGLDPAEALALARYRRSLEDQPLDTILDANRDQRFDPLITRASIRQGEARLDQERIDRMCRRYERRALRNRARRVADHIISELRFAAHR